jgi:hypothetical protein
VAKEPWKMTRDEFAKAIVGGKMYRATGKPPPSKKGSLKTELSLGESENYPSIDIAAFYVAKRSPPTSATWPSCAPCRLR